MVREQLPRLLGAVREALAGNNEAHYHSGIGGPSLWLFVVEAQLTKWLF